MARPTKLDDVTAQRVIAALREGNARSTAARSAGIHPDTLCHWLARGRSGEEPYSEFSVRIKRAEADGELALVQCIRSAALEGKTWQCAAWLLERRFPQRWARKERPVIEKHRDASALGEEELAAALADALFKSTANNPELRERLTNRLTPTKETRK